MPSRKPLLAALIALGALLVLMIASAPARAAEPVPLNIDQTGMGVLECSVEGGPFKECEEEGEYAKGTVIALRGNPAPTVGFLGFSKGTGSAVGCKGPAECVLQLEAASSLDVSFTPLV